jgi:hypothetical protein
VPPHDPEYAFAGEHALPVEVRGGLALIGRNGGRLLVLAMPGAHVAERMGDFPDAILVGD